jgi:High potential iron-sulfur protein
MRANRRLFLISTAALGQIALVDRSRSAVPVVDPADPQASALGYTADATKVPAGFADRHVTGAHCGNCALFQGRAVDSPGPCPLFGGKSVQGQGWCASIASPMPPGESARRPASRRCCLPARSGQRGIEEHALDQQRVHGVVEFAPGLGQPQRQAAR